MHLSRFILLGFTTSAWAVKGYISGYPTWNCKEAVTKTNLEGDGCHLLDKPAHGLTAHGFDGYKVIAYRGGNCANQVGAPYVPNPKVCLSDHDGIPDNINSSPITSVKIVKK